MVLEPNSWDHSVGSYGKFVDTSSTHTDIRTSAANPAAEADGLNFIANWIDLIIAKLRVSVKDVTISLCDCGTSTSCPLVVVKLWDIDFYNSKPESGSGGHSFANSFRSQSASTSFMPGLGKQKVGFRNYLKSSHDLTSLVTLFSN